MSENKLECCVVRDLLPSYIENLTEPETTAMVKEHLEGCAKCAGIERNMRGTVPIERAPKRALRFLKHVKRTRLLAAALSLILALLCMWWLYDQEFHYPNTETGRLEAVQDYIIAPEDSTMQHVPAGTTMRAVAWDTIDNHLFIFYFAENDENVHGVIHLVRGINGKYRPLSASETPSRYSGGLYGGGVSARGIDEPLFYLAGYNCRDIYSAEVEFTGSSSERDITFVNTFELDGEDFLRVMDYDELEETLASMPDGVTGVYIDDVRLFDKDGQDITAQYKDEEMTPSWGAGIGTAETFMVYVLMGIVAILGIVFIRYFLRRD